MTRWWGRCRDEGKHDGGAQIEAAIGRELERYAEVRLATAGCLYAAHKLAGEADRQREIAEAARRSASEALEARDTRRSRAMVSFARTALDLARDAEGAHEELRASADATLDVLRAIAQTIAELERERLRAHALGAIRSHAPASLEETRRTLAVLEAERALDAELSREPS